MPGTYRKWNYTEIKHILDRVGTIHYPRTDVLNDLASELSRTRLSVWSLHYSWLTFNGQSGSHQPVSKNLKVLFSSYASDNPTVRLSTKTNGEVKKMEDDTKSDESIDEAIKKLEAQFEALKSAMAELIMLAADDKAKKEVAVLQQELLDLRKFKEEVKDVSVMTMLRQKLTGR